jgi:hypothetical protein
MGQMMVQGEQKVLVEDNIVVEDMVVDGIVVGDMVVGDMVVEDIVVEDIVEIVILHFHFEDYKHIHNQIMDVVLLVPIVFHQLLLHLLEGVQLVFFYNNIYMKYT